MIRLPRNNIKNAHLDKTIAIQLGKNWSVTQSTTDWVISLNSDKIGADYITDITFSHLEKDHVLKTICDVLEKVENKAENNKFNKAVGLTGYKHTTFVEYGVNAWMYAGRTMFFMTPYEKFSDEDREFFEKVATDYKARQSLIYRKNIMPFMAILSIRKYAYILVKNSNFTSEDIEKNHFWGTIPSGMDFATYIDPFLVFTPLTICLPFDRATSGILVIPEQSLVTPYEANVGWAELMVTSASGFSASGTFEIFGPHNYITKIFIKRYCNVLLNGLNSFLEWLLNPRTSFDNHGNYSAGFGLQILATVNSIFNSFTYCARYINSDIRTSNAFSAFDKIANLAANYSFLKAGKIGTDTSTLEAKLFSKFFTDDFLKETLILIRTSIPDEKVGKLLAEAAKSALKDVSESLVPFQGDVGDTLRVVRNMAHGAFLKNDKFLKTFGQGRLSLSPRICVLLYMYMLCFLLKPDEFLKALVK